MRVIAGKVVSGSNDTGYPENEKHAFLAFIGADEDQMGIEICTEKLANLGWCSPEISRIGTLDHNSPPRSDPIVKGAHDHARETGFGVVIYSDPILEIDGEKVDS